MGDWNAILDPKLNRGGRGATGLDGCEIRLIDLLAEHELVDRLRQDHPGREMWTWLRSSPSGQSRSYLNRVLDSDFVTCPMFLWIGQTDHKLVRISLKIVNTPSLVGYLKFKTSLLLEKLRAGASGSGYRE